MAFYSHCVMPNFFFFFFLFSFFCNVFGQSSKLENDDCYDFSYSHLGLEFILSERKIIGFNELYFQKQCPVDTFLLSLVDNFIVDSILLYNEKVKFLRKDDKIIIPNTNLELDSFVFKVFYQGLPPIAKNPPWEGGFVWDKDYQGLDWVGVACQQEGASLWWPNNENLSDEPDSVKMSFLIEHPYEIVSNGRLRKIKKYNQKQLFEWFVSNPINNYNITFNIGVYSHFNETFQGQKGDLDLDFYVLPENIDVAKQHFLQVQPMLHTFETIFGPYPFYEDGYKLVETPYLGMEHQSCIAYGNNFQKGYLGRFPEDIDFDFIIIHETAHEWWGNNVSMQNRRDMWIHEAFATYAEALYVESLYDYDKMLIYLNYQRKFIMNHYPIMADNHSGTDMYYKGAWMLHTLRMILKDDSMWFDILKGLQIEFKHSTVNTDDIIHYIESSCECDLLAFFQQYLYQSDLPDFEYFITRKRNKYFLNFKWSSCVSDFNMPILVTISDNLYDWIHPTTDWKKIELLNINEEDFKVSDDMFLIDVIKIK